MWKGNKTWWKQVMLDILVIVVAVTFSLSGWIGVRAKGTSRPNLNTTSMFMYTGQAMKLTVKNTKAKARWSTSNKKVASVSTKGLVRAVKSGRCIISAKVKGKTLKCRVEVVTKQKYYGRNLYSLVRKKGVKGPGGLRQLSMKEKDQNSDDYYVVTVSAYPDQWTMDFDYEQIRQEPSDRTMVNVNMDILRMNAGYLQCAWNDYEEDYRTYVTGTLDKSYDGKKKGMNLKTCTAGSEDSRDADQYEGKPRAEEWQKAVPSVKTAFSSYDKLLKKYGYSMKKIGFTKY